MYLGTRSRFGRAFFRTTVSFALVAVILETAVSHASAANDATTLAVPVIAAQPPIDGTIGAAWADAAQLELAKDFTNRRAADEATTVRLAQDATDLLVAFDVSQHESVISATVTNGPGVTSDDYVEVALSPDGPQGFQYAFYANARGARYQTSSENSAYAPPWEAAARARPGGYTLTMRIPFAIIRSGGRTSWRAQFARATIASNALDVWAFNEHASSMSDATFFGTITDVDAQVSAPVNRPRARAQLYGLGELTPRSYGGDTSRVGGDFALPIASTTSLLASIHPDYSNVETDQQTIAPTAFARSYTEVRPFFTQASQAFNNTFGCFNCPQMLYTPAIPTYRDAYAVEGTRGPLTFAAFDAVGVGRDDSAEVLDDNVSNAARALGIDVQSVTVNEVGGIRDQVDSLSSGYLNQHTHFGAYLNYGDESGSTVAASREGTYYQTGAIYLTATSVGSVSWQHIGADYNPLDAYVAQNDVSGPQLFLSKTIPFKVNSILHDIALTNYDASFANHAGLPSQNDLTTQANIDFSNLLTVHAYTSESAVRTFANEFLPFDGNGALFGYKFNTATPTYVDYVGGPYYHGRLDTWNYLSTLPVAPKVHLSLEADRNSYFTSYPNEAGGTQWLERATLDVQFNRETQFDLGLRRLIGPQLPTSYAPPDFAPLDAGNVTAALHFLSKSGRDEIYLVYGDPNSLATTPAFFAKYIFYLGAPKGT
jgi:hypothetical protein